MLKLADRTPASRLTAAERRESVRRLTAEDRDSRQIAEELGCSQSTVVNDWQALGISRPPGRRAKHPAAPTNRRCEMCCELLVFRFPSDAYRLEGGQLVDRRYCSDVCKYEAISKYPKPTPRPCRKCGKTFQPVRAHGDQIYCSIECTRTGELVACQRCDREMYLAGWAIRRGYRFCGYRCWAGERWQHGIGLARLVERFTGGRRRFWKLKWLDRPGRPRNDARLDYEEALERIRAEYERTHCSERELQRLTSESRRMIRTALGRSV